MYWIELGYRCVRLAAAAVPAARVASRGLESSYIPRQMNVPTKDQIPLRGCNPSARPVDNCCSIRLG